MDDTHVSDQTLTDMVRHLRPSWRVVGVDRIEEGANDAALVEVTTPTGARRVVLKTVTSSHPLAETRTRDSEFVCIDWPTE
ncbi:hypothetical protein [Haloferax sp. YSSS75]|uniref:hypothetical protein n=1 Tax=Haloferax sp. YSSS75 TaxID=3388564 RepID=UPI00398CACA8